MSMFERPANGEQNGSRIRNLLVSPDSVTYDGNNTNLTIVYRHPRLSVSLELANHGTLYSHQRAYNPRFPFAKVEIIVPENPILKRIPTFIGEDVEVSIDRYRMQVVSNVPDELPITENPPFPTGRATIDIDGNVTYMAQRTRGIVFKTVPEIYELTKLTEQELEVGRLIAHGYESSEIAILLGISPNTVHTHAKNAIRKMESRNRTHLATRLIRLGFDVDIPGGKNA